MKIERHLLLAYTTSRAFAERYKSLIETPGFFRIKPAGGIEGLRVREVRFIVVEVPR